MVPANLEANVSALHEFLFDTPGYTPTSQVQRISSVIENETGVGAQEITITPYVAEQ